MAQLRASGVQKGEHLKLLPVLRLKHLPPTLGIGRHVGQATGILLGDLSGSAVLHKLALKQGKPLDKAFDIPVSRG
jgi:hypothetical protein